MIRGKMKKVLILEDNPVMREHLANIVREINVCSTVYQYDNVSDAYRCAIEKTIDLFVIDIILDTNSPGDSSGLMFVENIRKIADYEFAPIIFVTSLEDSKLYTYEKLHCYAFIEKPFDVKRMKQAIEQCMRFSNKKENNKTLYFRKEGIILAVDCEDIVYIESMNHVMQIHTKQNDVLSIPYKTVKGILEDIDGEGFVQCS